MRTKLTEDILKNIIRETIEEMTLEQAKAKVQTIVAQSKDVNQLFQGLASFLMENRKPTAPKDFKTPGELLFGL